MKRVLSLNEIAAQKDAVAQAGGKAWNLSQLYQADFPVPAAFCLTADAYRYHLITNNLTGKIDALLRDANLSDGDKADHIQRLIIAADLPSDLRAALIAAWRQLGDAPVAVRSSAPSEDAALTSFAGQHDTFLDVRNQADLLANVKQCWASLWTARSLSYRARLQARPEPVEGADDSVAALAVVVQTMVPARCAGVAFTVNPLTGAEEIVLEAVSGLGERLVSGEAAPDRYRVDKETGEVRETAPQGQTPLLNLAQIKELARLAARIERHFGQPQDIEWARDNERFYVLQSRPVTTQSVVTGMEIPTQLPPDFVSADGQIDMAALLRRADETGSEIWTDDNVGEVVPGVVTPLSWSVLEPLGNGAFRRFLQRAGVRRYPPAGLFGRFYGRVYFNQSQFQRMMHRFYPSSISQSGGGSRLTGIIRAALRLTETGLRTLFLILTLPAEVRRLTKSIPQQLADIPASSGSPRSSRSSHSQTLFGNEKNEKNEGEESFSNRKLWAESETWRQIGQQVLSVHLAVSIFATLFYSLLDKLVTRWSDNSIETAHLLAALPGMKSAEMGRDLADLAAEAAAEPGLKSCLADASADELVRCVAELPADNRFVRHLERFLSKHGHASLREFELAFPRWRDDAGYVLLMLQNHLRAHNAGAASNDAAAQQVMRQRAAQAMRWRLGFGPRRASFEFLLYWTRRFSVARENAKYTFVMAHSHLRDLYLRLAHRLQEQGALTDSAGLFYLRKEELSEFLAGHIGGVELGEILVRRQTEQRGYENAQTAPPKIIEEWPDGSLRAVALPADANSNGTALRGVAASPGRVTGRARVILNPLDSTRLERGEILVAPSTNPAWSPLFLNAGALITEVGGLLSHGAIVAREYGLPAVLNVKDATKTIRTGQLLAVDGYTGTVRLLDD